MIRGEPMASQHRLSFDDMTLVALEQALRDVWQILKAHDPDRKESELHKGIAELLMALADSSVTDPHELRSRTLKYFDLKRSH